MSINFLRTYCLENLDMLQKYALIRSYKKSTSNICQKIELILSHIKIRRTFTRVCVTTYNDDIYLVQMYIYWKTIFHECAQPERYRNARNRRHPPPHCQTSGIFKNNYFNQILSEIRRYFFFQNKVLLTAYFKNTIFYALYFSSYLILFGKNFVIFI